MPSRTITCLAAAVLLVGACSSSTEPQAVSLSFRQQPANSTTGQPITPAVRVGFIDGQAGQVTNTDALITVALIPTTGSQGANLSGTLTVQSVDGVATFSDLSIDQAGAGFQLAATADEFEPRNSNPFNVQ